MADDRPDAPSQEPDTENSAPVEDEAPTEEHEATASETQVSELATVELLADEVDELRAKAAERDDFLDKLQRSKADFINYQKRSQRERERWKDTAVQDLCLRILPALDDLQRALDAAEEDHNIDSLIEGIQLIRAKLLKALADDGVEPIHARHEPFDPAFHEAVSHLPDPDVPDHTIVEEVTRGYLIRGRVLRASQVVVATGGERRDEPNRAEPPPLPTTPDDEPQDDDTADMDPGGDPPADEPPQPDA